MDNIDANLKEYYGREREFFRRVIELEEEDNNEKD